MAPYKPVPVPCELTGGEAYDGSPCMCFTESGRLIDSPDKCFAVYFEFGKAERERLKRLAVLRLTRGEMPPLTVYIDGFEGEAAKSQGLFSLLKTARINIIFMKSG